MDPLGGSSSTVSRLNWNLNTLLLFVEFCETVTWEKGRKHVFNSKMA